MRYFVFFTNQIIQLLGNFKTVFYRDKPKITLLLFLLIGLFPAFPPAIQSISIFLFSFCSIILYTSNCGTRVQSKKFLIAYFSITGFFWWSVCTFFWSSDMVQFREESKIQIAFIVIVTSIFFFYPTVTKALIHKILFSFITGVAFYIILFFGYLIDGIDTYHRQVLDFPQLSNLSIWNQLKELYLMKKYAVLSDTQPEFRALRGNIINQNTVFFYHHTYIGAFFNFTILVCLYFIREMNRWKTTIFLSLYVVLLVYLMWFIDSKINLALSIVIVPLCFLFIFFTKKNVLRIIVLIVALTVSFDGYRGFPIGKKLVHFNLYQKEFSHEESGGIVDYTRYTIYKKAYHCIRTMSPLIGIGIGDIRSSLSDVEIGSKSFDKNVYLNAHSQYIHYLLGSGLIGLCLYLYFIGFSFYIGVTSNDYLFLGFILIFSINCLFENFLSRLWGVYFISFFSAVFVSQYLSKNE
jgi:hypothetical protein